MACAQHMAELVHDHAGEIAVADAVADDIDEAAAAAGRHRKSLLALALMGDRVAAVDPRHDPGRPNA